MRRILFVCTANICRSPTAEYLSRHRFDSGHWRFRSAGFLESGRAPSNTLVQALGELGVSVEHHRSYRLDRASIAAAELLLTMEGSHVRRATEIDPSAYPKTVPLKEAALILADMAASMVTVEELLEAVADRRDPAAYLGDIWDVDDPYGRNLRTYRRTVVEIGDLIDSVLGRLR